jgi:hypothetical protein
VGPLTPPHEKIGNMKKLYQSERIPKVDTLQLDKTASHYYARNTRLGDTWVTENPRELVDLIADNTGLSLTDINCLIGLLVAGDLKSFTLTMSDDTEIG